MMRSHVKEMIVMKTVNEVSKLTGVSIRTLQYYDKIYSVGYSTKEGQSLFLCA